MEGRTGFSTVEGLVAIVLLSMAALGVAGTMTRSARILGVAHRTAAAARATEQVVGQLGARLRAAGSRCTAAGSGVSPFADAMVSWTAAAASGGVEFTLVTTHPGSRRLRSDTLWLFMPCS